MRGTLRIFVLTAVLLLLIPSAVLLPRIFRHKNVNFHGDDNAVDTSVYNVFVTAEGAVQKIPVRDYLIGAVAAEMPASYSHDALCAQVIASHTYAERMRMNHIKHPDSSILGADFSDDSSLYQAFYSDAELRSLWGEDYAENYKKITDAVDAVGDLVLYHENEPIVAAFHAISAGKTESAEEIWGAALPYLVSVPSPEDINAPQYETVSSFSAGTFSTAIRAVRPDLTFSDSPSEWVGTQQTTAAGTVLRIAVGSGSMSGEELRNALSLRSACFTVRYDADTHTFDFTVHGYGHLVGMSQFGANQMALSGASYSDILQHYYPGTELRSK